MVSQKFNLTKILIIIIAFIAFVFCSFPSSASGSVPRAVWTCEQDGQDYYYYKTDRFYVTVDGSQREYIFDKEVIVLPVYYKVGNQQRLYIYFFSKEKTPYTYNMGSSYYNSTTYSNSGNWFYYFHGGLASSTITNPEPSNFQYNGSDVISKFITYLDSSSYVEPSSPDMLDLTSIRNDINFGLQNVKAECENDILTLSWSLPLSIPDYVTDMPILLDLIIENSESGESSVYYFPSTESRFVRPSLCDVADVTYSFDVRDIQGIPENFTIKSLTLTPYYKQHLDYLDMDILYKGQISHVFLNYSGVDDKIYSDLVIQTPPDTDIIEEDMPTSIFGAITNFFSGFFNNFGTMLKNLFIPTKEQLTTLFGSLEDFFNEKLGFLWYPFDLAIQIVEALSQGEAKSTITFPGFTLPLDGGIQIWSDMEFEIDQVGIFPVVRMVTSIVLACSVAGLAYKKWDEWIGGTKST